MIAEREEVGILNIGGFEIREDAQSGRVLTPLPGVCVELVNSFN